MFWPLTDFLPLNDLPDAWKSLKEQVAEKSMKLSDMAMYRIAIENFKLQVRKVKASQQIFTSYGALEVRLLVTKAEITERKISTPKQMNPEEL